MTENSKIKILVFALKQEDTIPDYPGFIKIFTGVGKINAALSLTKAIESYHPILVVNFGTSGGITLKKGDCVECNTIVQIDMDCSAMGYKKYQTPGDNFNSIVHQTDGKMWTCGTSDSFLTSKISLEQNNIDLVDMEAYALAKVCEQYMVKFKCFKYITDKCDTTSPIDWKENLKKAKPHFEQIMKRFI